MPKQHQSATGWDLASWFNICLLPITIFYVIGSIVSIGLKVAQDTGHRSVEGWWVVFFPFVPCAIVCLFMVLYRILQGQKAKYD